MRRLLLTGLLAALALAPSAHGQLPRGLALPGDSLSLENGQGMAVVTSRSGAMLGTIDRGRVRITDLPRGHRTSVKVWGCERRRRLARRTVLCVGREIRFRIEYGTWRAVLQGRGIDASAVVEGSLAIRGSRGTFAIEGEERRWPDELDTFTLG